MVLTPQKAISHLVMTIEVGISKKKNIKNFDHVQILWNDPYMLFLTFLHMWYGQVVVTQFNQRRVVVPNLQTIVFIFLSLISRQISVHTTYTHQVTLNLTKIHNPASFSNFHHKLFVLNRFPEF